MIDLIAAAAAGVITENAIGQIYSGDRHVEEIKLDYVQQCSNSRQAQAIASNPQFDRELRSQATHWGAADVMIINRPSDQHEIYSAIKQLALQIYNRGQGDRFSFIVVLCPDVALPPSTPTRQLNITPPGNEELTIDLFPGHLVDRIWTVTVRNDNF